MPAKSQTTVVVSGGDEFAEGPTEQALGAAPPGDSRSQSQFRGATSSQKKQNEDIMVIEESIESEQADMAVMVGADDMTRSNENVQINITTMSKPDERLSQTQPVIGGGKVNQGGLAAQQNAKSRQQQLDLTQKIDGQTGVFAKTTKDALDRTGKSVQS